MLDLFLRYRWPGNVRELEAAIHRALVLSRGDSLTLADFGWISLRATPRRRRRSAPNAPSRRRRRLAEGSYEERLDALDRQLSRRPRTLPAAASARPRALLGIARNTLQAKMKKYGLAGEG